MKEASLCSGKLQWDIMDLLGLSSLKHTNEQNQTELNKIGSFSPSNSLQDMPCLLRVYMARDPPDTEHSQWKETILTYTKTWDQRWDPQPSFPCDWHYVVTLVIWGALSSCRYHLSADVPSRVELEYKYWQWLQPWFLAFSGLHVSLRETPLWVWFLHHLPVSLMQALLPTILSADTQGGEKICPTWKGWAVGKW